MGDRAQCHIEIGGNLPASALGQFAATVSEFDLRTDWDGEPFDPDCLPVGQSLELYGDELNGGLVQALEGFCKSHGLQFRRWSGGCAGAFNPELVAWFGPGEEFDCAATEDECACFVARDIERAESLGALREVIAGLERPLPAFCVTP